MKTLFGKIFLFFFFFSVSIHSEDTWEFNNKNYKKYKTDVWELVTDLPESYAIPYVEYSQNFAILTYQFISDWRNESPKLKGKITIFSNCSEFKLYLLENKIKKSNPYFFRKIKQESWNEFELAGCYVTNYHLIKTLQHEITISLLYNKEKKLPLWLTQGFAYYLTFSNYIHDDESVIPYPDQNYIFKLYKMFKTSKGLIELKDLLLLDRKLFYKKKKYTFPQSWSLVRFFMDVYPEGRKILKNYYRESADANEFSDVEDQSYEKVFHNKRTDSWSNYDVIWEKYSEWFNKIEEPKGFEYYLKAKEALTFKTKTENLEIAISLNPTYARYYSAISKVYLDEPDFEKSLEYSEKAIKLQLTNKQALEVAIISAFRLEKFSVSEFYFKIYEEFYELSEDMKELKKTVQDWRGTNPELPHYSHLNEDVEVFINPK